MVKKVIEWIMRQHFLDRGDVLENRPHGHWIPAIPKDSDQIIISTAMQSRGKEYQETDQLRFFLSPLRMRVDSLILQLSHKKYTLRPRAT